MLLEVKNINAGYGFLQILRDVSFNIDQGEYACIIGPNGAGKSTTMKTIAGLVRPMGGEIIFNGENIAGMSGNKVARKGSWVSPIALVVDQEFPPDEPTVGLGCPDWCRNACIVACPTGALKGSRHLDPRKCISYLTYYGEGITPLELREPMGLWVYGCDRCQNVCPRNAPWLAKQLPTNAKVAAMQADFTLSKLLHMDEANFKEHIWPHMFYMGTRDIWRWKMNVARAMGNTLEERYLSDLEQAIAEESDSCVRGMAAWAMGRIGGLEAEKRLQGLLPEADPQVAQEIQILIGHLGGGLEGHHQSLEEDVGGDAGL